MKRIIILLAIFWSITLSASAQVRHGLERTVLKQLEAYYQVDPNCFLVQRDQNDRSETLDLQYLYMAKNEVNGLYNVFDNHHPLINFQCQIRPYRMGCMLRNSVFVVKFLDHNEQVSKYGKEAIVVMNDVQEACDSIIEVFDDGYVFRNGDMVFHKEYLQSTTNPQFSQIVWPEKRTFKPSDSVYFADRRHCKRLSADEVYYRSAVFPRADKSKSHYYYLYRDSYMPYSVLVVDGKEVELFGQYSYDDLKLKYSYDGRHWMAVAGDRFWVDGKMKSMKGYSITEFLINNKGDYVIKAKETDAKNKTDVVVMNGQVILRDAYVGYFHLNSEQKLKFHFLSGGRKFVYDDGSITDVTKNFMTISYSEDRVVGQSLRINSDDGHYLSYVTGRRGVKVDGVQCSESEPLQVLYNNEEHCFRWNAIETANDGTIELVVYKYYLGK